MKYIIVSLCLLVSAPSFAQTSLSQENAETIIKVFFEGFHKGDTTQMKSVMMPNMMMQTAFVSRDDGNKVSYSRGSDFVKMVGQRDPKSVWKEEILDYRLETDGNIAHVWTPYRFYVDGNFSHCGANSFTLVFTDESWKILNVIDSRRIGSCDN